MNKKYILDTTEVMWTARAVYHELTVDINHNYV